MRLLSRPFTATPLRFATVRGVGEDEVRGASKSLIQRCWESLRRHPYITGTFVVCTALGGVLGLFLLTGEWSAIRRVLGGSVAGASTALLVTATKLYE
ncbi:MAG: hypothetical protein ABFS46_18390 [Myxococcota bacterium]